MGGYNLCTDWCTKVVDDVAFGGLAWGLGALK